MNVSNERKRELKEEYRLMKPDMGVFAVVCKSGPRYYLEATKDIKSAINSTQFKLNAGVHPKKDLQEDWKEIGSEGFEIKILEMLEYDKDESKTDYQDDLALLKMVWVERLTGQSIDLY